MNIQHPAVRTVLDGQKETLSEGADLGSPHSTSLSLARALSIGCLSRLDPGRTSVRIWDPACGSGFAGFLLVEALRSVGIAAQYRGQDIDDSAVAASRRRFEGVPGAEFAAGNTLTLDQFDDFSADLVIVDAPWGMAWRDSASAVEARRDLGEFRFGVPEYSDSTWLFISLALEKLRPAAEGGGRVAALVNPGSLRAGAGSSAVRRRIVEAGLLESVVRLPDGLASTTSIPLYLITLTNKASKARRGKAMIADLQTMFTMKRARRYMPIAALEELESGLRTGKPGPRNRSISVRQFIRRDVRVTRVSDAKQSLSWRLTTYNDTPIDNQFLDSRYGQASGVSLDDEPREVFDLDPSRIFGDDSRDILKSIEANGWPGKRLSGLLAREPESLTPSIGEAETPKRQLYIPTTRESRVSAESPDTDSPGRILSIHLDSDEIDPIFLASWLNSEQGISSRRRAVEASSSGMFQALRSDPASLMRWADELIIPVPDRSTQLALASADQRLASFQAELSTQRERLWTSPESADDAVNRVASAFDDSLSAWLDHLPFPIASALWTAETAPTPGDQQRAYIHAWEAIVTFHATVLLSAIRCDPESSVEVEAAIRRTLREQHLSIERASFGTWVVIIEKIAKELRRALENDDPDEVARIRRAFGELSRTGIERLISKELVTRFNEVNSKRNRWLGHTGYTSEDEWRAQVISLVSDLSSLRQLLGNVWANLLLVRAGSARHGRDGLSQTAEIAVGSRSPFKTDTFSVGEPMTDGDLYLVKEGSQSPLRLGPFVQLRAAPRNAQYTTYFYNRTEGASVRMISYQHGPESELRDDADGFRAEFGALSDAPHGEAP